MARIYHRARILLSMVEIGGMEGVRSVGFFGVLAKGNPPCRAKARVEDGALGYP
jgi:hypothetical protein